MESKSNLPIILITNQRVNMIYITHRYGIVEKTFYEMIIAIRPIWQMHQQISTTRLSPWIRIFKRLFFNYPIQYQLSFLIQSKYLNPPSNKRNANLCKRHWIYSLSGVWWHAMGFKWFNTVYSGNQSEKSHKFFQIFRLPPITDASVNVIGCLVEAQKTTLRKIIFLTKLLSICCISQKIWINWFTNLYFRFCRNILNLKPENRS